MSNVDIAKPKFFVDHINNRLATGSAQDGNADVVSGTNLITATTNGTTESDLFDMRPMNQVQFNTTATQDGHVLINYDTGGGFNMDFVAILNHNMKDADCKVQLAHSNTENHVNNVNFAAGFTEPTCTEVLNGTVDSNNEVTPGNNGSTLFTFGATSHRYFGLQFEGTASNAFDGVNNLSIGCILIGEHYTMPSGPKIQLTRKITFDGVNVQESVGGQRFATATNTGKNWLSASNKSPFSTANQSYYVYGGRMSYDMEFTHLTSDQIMPGVYSVETASDSVVADVWNRTKGPMIPFIFTSDSTSTAESDYLFARFKSNSLVQQQIASNVFNIKLGIEEEF